MHAGDTVSVIDAKYKGHFEELDDHRWRELRIKLQSEHRSLMRSAAFELLIKLRIFLAISLLRQQLDRAPYQLPQTGRAQMGI